MNLAILATSLRGPPAFRIETQRRPMAPWTDPKEAVMLDILFCGLGLGLIGLMAAYVALLRRS